MKGVSAILLLVLLPLAFAQGILEQISVFLPPGSEVIGWLIGAALTFGLFQLIANTLAALVLPIPFVGPFLSFIIKTFGAKYQAWVVEQLPKLADQAWQATEAIAATSKKDGITPTSDEKREAATTILRKQAPDARMTDLEAALEAAHTRNKTGGLELSQ